MNTDVLLLPRLTYRLVVRSIQIPRIAKNDLKPNSFYAVRCYAKRTGIDPESLPRNPLKEVNSATFQADIGKIYDKKPFKYQCKKDKTYNWCSCGQSHTQPFCDGTHTRRELKIKLRPVKFLATENKEYWFCNCKQTSNRPFCDGTHKREDIQNAVK